MPLKELAELLSVIPSQRVVEATLECAPGTVTAEWARQWKALGINRVSLGVQSFVDSELRQTGRRHTAAIVENDVAVLRDAGLDNINVDLIAGLPGQTLASWEESLTWIERLRPPHVSVYIFEMDEESRLGKEAMLGGVRYGAAILPSDDLIADLYEVATNRLHDHGIYRYEISNFSEPGRESKHNLKYWKLEQYLGFGLDAHSFEGGHAGVTRTPWTITLTAAVLQATRRAIPVKSTSSSVYDSRAGSNQLRQNGAASLSQLKSGRQWECFSGTATPCGCQITEFCFRTKYSRNSSKSEHNNV